eukprot:4518716-Pleurochrysis_carterae.AAC.1
MLMISDPVCERIQSAQSTSFNVDDFSKRLFLASSASALTARERVSRWLPSIARRSCGGGCGASVRLTSSSLRPNAISRVTSTGRRGSGFLCSGAQGQRRRATRPTRDSQSAQATRARTKLTTYPTGATHATRSARRVRTARSTIDVGGRHEEVVWATEAALHTARSDGGGGGRGGRVDGGEGGEGGTRNVRPGSSCSSGAPSASGGRGGNDVERVADSQSQLSVADDKFSRSLLPSRFVQAILVHGLK